jgi:NAD(P)H-hydrate repair Nnr-like enzyme with NAD(P)H-hydrate dehydratase domain
MAGAAFLCAEAAARSGTGLVHLYSAAAAYTAAADPASAGRIACDTGVPGRDKGRSVGTPSEMNACAAGPGLDPSDTQVRDVLLYIAEHAGKVVLDAGALTVISREPDVFRAAFLARKEKKLPPAVLTPHPASFRGSFRAGTKRTGFRLRSFFAGLEYGTGTKRLRNDGFSAGRRVLY